eukprot:Em0009g57a
MAVINILAETSEKLLKVVLSCKVISGILDDSDSLSPLVALQREKAHLLSNQLEIIENLELKETLVRVPISENMSCASEPNESLTRPDTGYLEDKVERLNNKVWDVKTKYYQDGLLLERLQMGTVLQRHLFPTRPSDEKSDDDFEALMRAQTDCSLEQLCEVEKIRHLQKQLEAIQQERVAVMLKCRQLSADMKTQASLLQHTSKLNVQLKKALDCHNLLRHILQCVIISSGVDWSQDDDLLKLVLELGEPLSIVVPM